MNKSKTYGLYEKGKPEPVSYETYPCVYKSRAMARLSKTSHEEIWEVQIKKVKRVR